MSVINTLEDIVHHMLGIQNVMGDRNNGGEQAHMAAINLSAGNVQTALSSFSPKAKNNNKGNPPGPDGNNGNNNGKKGAQPAQSGKEAMDDAGSNPPTKADT